MFKLGRYYLKVCLTGYLSLEIRRAQGTPKLKRTPDSNTEHSDSYTNVIYIDLIDEKEEDHPPFIIFHFDFVAPDKPKLKRSSTAPLSSPEPTKLVRGHFILTSPS